MLRIQGPVIGQVPCNKAETLGCNCSTLTNRKVILLKLLGIAPSVPAASIANNDNEPLHKVDNGEGLVAESLMTFLSFVVIALGSYNVPSPH